jgi:hypothetical protein
MMIRFGCWREQLLHVLRHSTDINVEGQENKNESHWDRDPQSESAEYEYSNFNL